MLKEITLVVKLKIQIETCGIVVASINGQQKRLKKTNRFFIEQKNQFW